MNSERVLMMYAFLVPGVVCYFIAKYTDHGKLALFLKALCTAVILLASVSLPQAGTVVGRAVSAGLFFGLLGDVLIVHSIAAGMLPFGLGHLCYILAFCKPEAILVPGLPIFILCAAALWLLYKKSGVDLGALRLPVYGYAAIILVMLTAALSAPMAFGPWGWYAVLAGVLFTVSDVMLARSIFMGSGKAWDIVSLSCYYLGQSLFAVAVAAL